MSSFRRRTAVQPMAGTRPSPYNAAPLVSTGLTSIDDLLGGGLPLSTSLLIEADSPTSYADLLLRYWVAQGLECGQDVLVVASGLDGGPEGVVEALMDVDGGRSAQAAPLSKEDATDDEEERKQEEALKEKMKIAFRYEGLRPHQTTVDASRGSTAVDSGTYCSVFDLTSTRQLSPSDRKLLHLVDVDDLSGASSSSGGTYELLYEQIERLVESGGFRSSSDPSAPRKALRIALAGFGSPTWGTATPAALFSFLHRLQHLLRQSNASCVLTFPAHLYATTAPTASLPSSSTSSSPLLSRLSHTVDGVLRLTSFALSPLLSQTFPRHAGLLSTPKLPLLPPGTLVPPGSKLSVLRGLGGGSDARDNLVGFRVKRRRFVVEVVTDDPVGGDREDEEKRERERRRKKVEEANRKERDMAQGRSGAEIMLGMGERVAQVRIGGPDEGERGEGERGEGGAPGAGGPVRERSTGMSGGVGAGQAPRPAKKVSVARMVHERPDLLDF
ncbi:Elongator complex protein 4 [Rhodotorula diobovata]|uniref:Elongator complex protein 4 n=1 Tax=Rhodotorula diobovata TaxID=5288 RepID=A0A5C5FN73_9BASI|nr:Elongator complex protein 4 [Rhodotorula diobovata]